MVKTNLSGGARVETSSDTAADLTPPNDAANEAKADTNSRPLVYRDDRVATAAVVYEVVEHDGGWAYRVGETYSEAFPSRGQAAEAAAVAAEQQQRPGEDTVIEYQDDAGDWHEEIAEGGDRPTAAIEDLIPTRPESERQEVRSSGRTVRQIIQSRPILAVAIAAAFGYLLGRRKR